MSSKPFVVLKPEGRLDANHAPDLEKQLQEALGDPSVPCRMLIDMSDARYISSHGLRLLLATLKQAEQSGGSMALCCLNARVSEIMSMAGLDRVFHIYATRGEAERALTQ